jgi:hypothetical protein
MAPSSAMGSSMSSPSSSSMGNSMSHTTP